MSCEATEHQSRSDIAVVWRLTCMCVFGSSGLEEASLFCWLFALLFRVVHCCHSLKTNDMSCQDIEKPPVLKIVCVGVWDPCRPSQSWDIKCVDQCEYVSECWVSICLPPVSKVHKHHLKALLHALWRSQHALLIKKGRITRAVSIQSYINILWGFLLYHCIAIILIY